MQTFFIYTKPSNDHNNATNGEDIRVVSDSFNIFAAIFEILWCLYKNMWRVAGVFLVFNLIASYLSLYLELDINFNLLQLFQSIAFFIFAGELQMLECELSGYSLKKIVMAGDDKSAKLRYHDKVFANHGVNYVQ
jgi:hypothetical protein